MNILYAGYLGEGETSQKRLQALADLGHSVSGVNTGSLWEAGWVKRFTRRVVRRFFPALNRTIVNSAVLRCVGRHPPDLVWIDKGRLVRPGTLLEIRRRCPGVILVSYCGDDMMNPDNQTPEYLGSIRIYDHHVTTKTINVDELKALGARHVIFVHNAYCEHSHRPVDLTPQQRAALGGGVGFVGYWEQERADAMTYLAGNGIEVRVWGPWNIKRRYHPNLRVEGRPAWGDAYAATICAFDINLCFLRKVNRDRQTTRSIEIPACGGFMLAERTEEHLALFEEGKEAEFFGSHEELLTKARHYLAHDEERKAIAAAGRRRCIEGRYSNRERLEAVLAEILSTRDSQTMAK